VTDTSFVKIPKLEEYSRWFSEHLTFERKGGILFVRMHTKGGPVKWSFQMHQALAEAWTWIGHDLENEVLILTSTDPYWIGDFDHASFAEVEQSPDPNLKFDTNYHDCTKLVENFLWDIDIPTIAAINGPGLHTEFAIMADITLCTPDFVLRDDHFGDHTVPGDGQTLAAQVIFGPKRASYNMFTVKGFDAKTCVEAGAINEIVPHEKLIARAWEIAEDLMKQPRAIRRLSHQLTVRPWKRAVLDDFQVHTGHEFYGLALLKSPHHFEEIKSRWTDKEKNIKI
jgi:enoyl-CoA hydratase/carnithine racemase